MGKTSKLPKPYYEETGIVIYHADCRDIIPLLPKVDLVLTDPPYGVKLKGKLTRRMGGGTIIRPGSYSTPDTPDYIRDVVVPVVEMLRIQARRTVITPGTRNLWLYAPADDIGCFFYARGTGLGKWDFTCMQPILYYGHDPFLETGGGAHPNSYNSTCVSGVNKYDHPCAKPIQLLLWLVKRTSASKDVILDPFMGSGTTLVAAKQLGRQAIGIEIEEKYCRIAVKRLKSTQHPLVPFISTKIKTTRKPLFAPQEKTR